MKDTPKRVTLADISAKTGYTMNTVSRALRSMSDMSAATREKIQRVAAEMGYVRNFMASSLRSGRSLTIAVIVGGVNNPFYAIMVDTIHILARQMGYTVIMMCSRDNPEQEEAAVTTAIERQVEGVILYPSSSPYRSLELMRQSKIPFVLASRLVGGAESDCVICDEEMGGYLAGKHLIERGCRKLVFYYAFNVSFSSEQRIGGLRRAAKEAGLSDEDVLEYHYECDADAAEKMQHWKRNGYTGVFAFCDSEAWQFISLARSLGLENEFAIVGFDNIQQSIHFPGNLCSIDGAMTQIAEKAMLLLDRRIRHYDAPAQTHTFPVRLVCRGGCEALNNAIENKQTIREAQV